jgi:protocatechuate 3,4-dioxygenase beta subunit
MAAAAAAGAFAGASRACIVRPQQTEGPYFVDERLDRSDIRSDPGTGAVRPGVPLRLSFEVSRVVAGTCLPLAGALIDVWHCDALGVYSDVPDGNGRFDTRGQKFLRGHQRSDERGRAGFTTIYPGWYAGRAVHIHFKVRAQGGLAFTSQLYFDDAVSDAVHRLAPYASKGAGRVRNERDGLFRDGGRDLLLPLQHDGDGYASSFALGLQV